jgi:predicted DNA-binding protein
MPVPFWWPNVATKSTLIRLDLDLYEALGKVAKKNRRSATAELRELVLTWLQVSEEWALPED